MKLADDLFKHPVKITAGKFFKLPSAYSAARKIFKQLLHESAVGKFGIRRNAVKITAQRGNVFAAIIYKVRNVLIQPPERTFAADKIASEIQPHNSAAVCDFFNLLIG